MAIITFDTDTAIQKLIASGYVDDQARAIVRTVVDAQAALATKDDLELALAPLKTEAAVLKWMMGVLLAMNLSLVIKAFFP